MDDFDDQTSFLARLDPNAPAGDSLSKYKTRPSDRLLLASCIQLIALNMRALREAGAYTDHDVNKIFDSVKRSLNEEDLDDGEFLEAYRNMAFAWKNTSRKN